MTALSTVALFTSAANALVQRYWGVSGGIGAGIGGGFGHTSSSGHGGGVTGGISSTTGFGTPGSTTGGAAATGGIGGGIASTSSIGVGAGAGGGIGTGSTGNWLGGAVGPRADPTAAATVSVTPKLKVARTDKPATQSHLQISTRATSSSAPMARAPARASAAAAASVVAPPIRSLAVSRPLERWQPLVLVTMVASPPTTQSRSAERPAVRQAMPVASALVEARVLGSAVLLAATNRRTSTRVDDRCGRPRIKTLSVLARLNCVKKKYEVGHHHADHHLSGQSQGETWGRRLAGQSAVRFKRQP